MENLTNPVALSVQRLVAYTRDALYRRSFLTEHAATLLDRADANIAAGCDVSALVCVVSAVTDTCPTFDPLASVVRDDAALLLTSTTEAMV